MSFTDRISNGIVGSPFNITQIGWLGDSITINDFLGPTSQGATNQKLGFASIVSSYFGAFSDNQAQSGRILSSFLPNQSGAVGSAVKNFDGEWLLDGAQWYWWNPTGAGAWIAVTDTGSSVNRNATSTANLTSLINNINTTHVIIAQSGVNDNVSNNDAGAGDFGAHGSFHYTLLQNEIIKRLEDAGRVVIVVAGTTAADQTFHGVGLNARQEEIGRFSEAARQSAFTKQVHCCDVGLRLNIELSLGRVDILTRNSQVKPTNQTQVQWDAFLAATGDPSASTNNFRSFDETEDYLHIGDITRASYHHNLHPNAFGHYLMANEIIKFINEKGFI